MVVCGPLACIVSQLPRHCAKIDRNKLIIHGHKNQFISRPSCPCDSITHARYTDCAMCWYDNATCKQAYAGNSDAQVYPTSMSRGNCWDPIYVQATHALGYLVSMSYVIADIASIIFHARGHAPSLRRHVTISRRGHTTRLRRSIDIITVWIVNRSAVEPGPRTYQARF